MTVQYYLTIDFFQMSAYIPTLHWEPGLHGEEGIVVIWSLCLQDVGSCQYRTDLTIINYLTFLLNKSALKKCQPA